MRIAVALLIAGCVSFGALRPVRMQQAKPLRLGQVLTALRSRLASRAKKNRELIEGVRQRGVEFRLTPEIEQALKEEGASDELIAAIRERSRASTEVKNSPPATNRTSSRPRTIQNRYGIELVLIPPGSFMMGGDKYNDEKPVHRVDINYYFYMGRTEVTQAQWQAVTGNNPSHFKGDNLPVEQVSWNDAQAFIEKLNQLNDGYIYRLPSEAEWEYACRAGTTGDYAGDLDSMAWYRDNSGGTTHAVGTKQANGFGLYDMHGNVWEWCEDVYHSNYEGAPTDGSAWLSGGDSGYRVLRGGSCFNVAGIPRSAVRVRSTPVERGYPVGFRLVAVTRT